LVCANEKQDRLLLANAWQVASKSGGKPPHSKALRAARFVSCDFVRKACPSENRPMPDLDDMLRHQIAARGVTDPAVLEALRSVPREEFVPRSLRDAAYDDTPLPIGSGQTISQPFIVARMTALLRLTGTEEVLEVGTGSGYQTAVLARLAKHVYSAEIEPGLSREVRGHLDRLGITNVTLAEGDAVTAFPDKGPFAAILAAAAPETMPEPLLERLAEGGRCVIPVGSEEQYLWLLERKNGELVQTQLDAVRFVPMR
jgi:protein-L-isoaspartate(D-aspartate) O-methyltransferase